MEIVQRARAMVVSPASEWRAIEPESGDPGYLFANYAAILAAIPAVCAFVRGRLFSWDGFRFHHHFGLFGGLFGAVLHWVGALVMVYVMAVVIDGVAPTFSVQNNREGAMKLAVYSLTPAWLAGVFALVPGLGFLRFLALVYCAYVFWLGLPVLMKPPPDKLGSYAIAVVLSAVLLSMVIAAIVGPAL